MIATKLVSVEEYLNTDYSPDCDYVDGVVEERNVGRTKHADAQTEIVVFLHRLRRRLGIYTCMEQRVRVSATRFRVPDVYVIMGGRPNEEVVTTAPFLCVEILSPDDRLKGVEARIADYLGMGVRYVWLIDPYSLKAWTYTSEGCVEVADGVLRTKDPDIKMPLSKVLL